MVEVQKEALATDLSDEQWQSLEQARALAYSMDAAFKLPIIGIPIGVDGLVGLIPGIGDAITGGISLYIVTVAGKLDIAWYHRGRMLANIAVDSVIGAIPLIGDLFDIGFKANLRNLAIIERQLEKRGISLAG